MSTKIFTKNSVVNDLPELENITCIPTPTLDGIAYKAYQSRILSPSEQIADICYDILRTYSKFSDNLNSRRDKVKEAVIEIKNMYDKIMSLVPEVNISEYGLLIHVLKQLSLASIPWVLSDCLSYTKWQSNGKDFNLFHALQSIAYEHGLENKKMNQWILSYKEKYMKEILLLEKKGEKICMSKPLHEWYSTHVFDWGAVTQDNKLPWRLMYEHEHKSHTYPWEKNVITHRLKKGMCFGGTREHKIEIVDIGNYNYLLRENVDVKTTEDYHMSREHDGILIKHIGTDDGMLELFTVSGLKTYCYDALYPAGINLESKLNIFKYFRF